MLVFSLCTWEVFDEEGLISKNVFTRKLLFCKLPCWRTRRHSCIYIGSPCFCCVQSMMNRGYLCHGSRFGSSCCRIGREKLGLLNITFHWRTPRSTSLNSRYFFLFSLVSCLLSFSLWTYDQNKMINSEHFVFLCRFQTEEVRQVCFQLCFFSCWILSPSFLNVASKVCLQRTWKNWRSMVLFMPQYSLILSGGKSFLSFLNVASEVCLQRTWKNLRSLVLYNHSIPLILSEF